MGQVFKIVLRFRKPLEKPGFLNERRAKSVSNVRGRAGLSARARRRGAGVVDLAAGALAVLVAM